MRKTFKLICIVFCMLMLTSCIPENMEINDRLIIEAIGVDWEDEKYKVSIQVLETSNTGEGSSSEQSGGKGEGGKYTRVYEMEGETLSLAIQESTLIAGKRPLYSHNRVLIIGKEAADKKLMDIIDFMARSYDMRYTVSTAVYDGKAVEILKADDGTTIAAETIEAALESGKINAGIPHVTVFELARSLYDQKSGQYIPLVSLQKGDKGEYTDVKVSGAAIFGNNSMKCFLNEEETQGLVWLNDEVRDGIFETYLQDGQGVALKVISSNAKIKAEVENGNPKFTIKISCECDINEMPWAYSDSFDAKRLDNVRKVAEKQIYDEVAAAINKCIYENNCDVFQLIPRLWKSEREYYRQWSADGKYDFWNSVFEIETKVEIRRIIQNISSDEKGL